MYLHWSKVQTTEHVVDISPKSVCDVLIVNVVVIDVHVYSKQVKYMYVLGLCKCM